MVENVQIIDANSMIGIHPAHRLDMSVERLLQEMDKHHITANLIASTVGIFHSYTEGNAITLQAAKSNNRLVPVATVNPKSYFGSAADMQAIRAQGFRIFKFHPVEQGWEIGSAAFREVVKQLQPLNIPVMLNAESPGEPTTVASALGGYPAKVIMCGIQLDVMMEALAVLEEYPNFMMETHALHVPDALELIAGRVGADRIIFGSGAPRSSTASALQYVFSSALSDDDKKLILGGNIRRILEAG